MHIFAYMENVSKILLRIPTELKADLKKQADGQNRSLNSHIAYLLKNSVYTVSIAEPEINIQTDEK